MAATESRIRIIFDGVSRGVAAAAAQARAAIAGLESETRRIRGTFADLGSELDRFNLRFGAAFTQLQRTLLPINRGFRTLTLSVAALSVASAATVGGMKLIAGTVGALTQLAPAVLLLPAALLSAGAAMGTFKLATQGVGDALKAGLSGDMAKFAEATKNMAPAMQDALKAVVAFKPQIDDLRKSVQENFWAGFSTEITNLGNRYLPILKVGLSGIATQFNAMGLAAARAAQTPFFTNAIVAILARTRDTLTNMRPALANVLTGFVGLGEVGSRFLPQLGTAITNVTARFRDWVQQNSEIGGSIERLIADALRGFRDLGIIVVNTGSIINSIFTGMGFAFESPLASLRDLTIQAAEFLKTVEAQEGLRAFGDTLRELSAQTMRVFMALLQELLPILREWGPALEAIAQGLGDFLVAAIRTVGPLIRELGTFLSANADTIRDLMPLLLTLAVAVKALIVFTQVAKWAATARSAFVLLQAALTGIGPAAAAAAARIGIVGANLRLLKVAGVAAAIAGVAIAMDELNVAAAGGEENLSGWDENLNDIAGAIKQIASLDFAGIFRDIAAEVTALGQTWSQGEAPVQRWAASIGSAVTSAASAVGSFFSNLGSTIAANAATAWNTLTTTAQTAFDTVVSFVTGLPARIGAALSSLGASIAAAATGAWNSLVTSTQTAIETTVAATTNLPFRVGFALGQLIGTIMNLATQAWNGLITATTTAINAAVTFAQSLPGRIGSAIASLGSTLVSVATSAWNSFLSTTQSVANSTVNFVRSVPGMIQSALSALAGFLTSTATAAWNGFLNTTRNIANSVVAFVRSIPGMIQSALSSLAGILSNLATQAMNGFLNAIRTGANAVLGFIRSLPGQIAAAAGNMGSVLVGAGRALMDGLLSGIRAAYQSVLNFVRGIAAGIAAVKGPLPYDAVVMIPAGKALMAGLQTGIERGYAGVASYVSGLAPDLAGRLSAAVSPSVSMSGLSATAPNPSASALQQLLSLRQSETPIQVTVLLDGQPVRDIARTEVAASARSTRRTVSAGPGATF